MARFRKTPGEQGFKSKSCESSELDEGETSIGACDNLQMVGVLTTSSQIVVKIAAICKTPPSRNPFACSPLPAKTLRSRPIPRNDSREQPPKPKRAFRKAETVEPESTPIPLTPSTPPSGGLRPSLPTRARVLADGRRATAQRCQEDHRSGPRWTAGAMRGRSRMHLAIPDMRCCKKMTCLRPHGAD